MRLTPARLLRLYPGLWRLRYGSEFLALLESAPITRTVVKDVVRSAAQEWALRTRVGRVLIGLTVGSASALCGLALAQVASPPPLRAVVNSGWGIAFAVVVSAVPMAIGALLVVAAGPRFAPVGFRRQLLALFLVSTFTEWLVLSMGRAVDSDRILSACMQGGFYVTFWLTLIYNVERNREMSTKWPRLWPGPSADRY